jgi:hypothetical protein
MKYDSSLCNILCTFTKSFSQPKKGLGSHLDIDASPVGKGSAHLLLGEVPQKRPTVQAKLQLDDLQLEHDGLQRFVASGACTKNVGFLGLPQHQVVQLAGVVFACKGAYLQTHDEGPRRAESASFNI